MVGYRVTKFALKAQGRATSYLVIKYSVKIPHTNPPMYRHEIDIEDLSQGGKRGRNLFLPGISVLEAYELQGGGLHKYEGPGFTVKEIT